MSSGRHRQVMRISLLLCAMYALLAARLYHVQVTEAATLSRTQIKYQTRLPYRLGSAQFERPPRGAIYDRNGKSLAVGYDTFRLLLDMYPLHKPRKKNAKPLSMAQRIDVLSGVLDDLAIEHSKLDMLEKAADGYYNKVMPNGEDRRVCKRGIVLLKGLLPWHRRYIKKIMHGLRITNFGFLADATRQYPHGELVAEIVGFVGQNKETKGEIAGRAGIEASMEGILAATPGKFVCEKDGRGKEMELNASWQDEPEFGYDVNLTLDVDVQEIAADALAKACKAFNCPSGSAIVLDSNTGEILAMTSYPRVSVEAVRAGDISAKDFTCLPFTATFEPGSTIKPLILAKAIEKGKVRWLQTFDTNNGRRIFRSDKRNRWVSDSHPNQVLTAEEVIIKSSNIGIAMIGFEEMGYDELVNSIHELGLQNRIKLRMPGSPKHEVPMHNNPRQIDAGVSVPFG
ncbi:MAG: cell division protein FtsI/penicillin-binding protein 2, partial [Planctomycetota bacterium]